MSSTKTVPDAAKDEFWAVVGDCLHEFHGMKPEMIRGKARKLRNAIERMAVSQIEFFYHSEPFDLACEIAGESLNVEEFRDRYLHIRDGKHANGTLKQSARRRRT
jgi:hypothetical protein